MNLKKKLKIIDIDVIDLNVFNDSFKTISVNVEVLLYKMKFTIEYYMPHSNNTLLKPRKSSVEYPMIKSICTKHNIDFNFLLDTIKEQSKAQEIWNEYIEENYPKADSLRKIL